MQQYTIQPNGFDLVVTAVSTVREEYFSFFVDCACSVSSPIADRDRRVVRTGRNVSRGENETTLGVHLSATYAHGGGDGILLSICGEGGDSASLQRVSAGHGGGSKVVIVDLRRTASMQFSFSTRRILSIYPLRVWQDQNHAALSRCPPPVTHHHPFPSLCSSAFSFRNHSLQARAVGKRGSQV